MKIGFTRDRDNYTYETEEKDSLGKPIWAVRSIPHSWSRFGRPAKKEGEDGLLGNHFYPLRVLHNLKV